MMGVVSREVGFEGDCEMNEDNPDALRNSNVSTPSEIENCSTFRRTFLGLGSR